MVKAKRKSPRHSARQSRAGPRPRAKAKPKAVTVAALKRAVEGRNAAALAGMYAEDAVMLVIDRDHPPSSPRRLAGKAEIASYFGDVCGRDMTHMIESGVARLLRLLFPRCLRARSGRLGRRMGWPVGVGVAPPSMASLAPLVT
jgi:hypothetical protein